MATVPADANPAATPDTKFWEGLKWTAQLLGIVGGGGSGFAALSFGIGYLAIKHHDAMLGLPTTSVPYTAYVRAGALFFTTALQSMVTVLTPPLWGGVTLAVLFVLLLLVGGASHAREAGPPLTTRTQAIVLAVACVIVLVLSLRSLPLHSAPLEPMNRSLLLSQAEPTDEEKSTQAFQVWEQLRNDHGENWLQKRFGLQCFSVLGLIYLGWVFYLWRQKLSGAAGGGDVIVAYCLTVSDWVVRPLQIFVVLIMLAMLPANYGVLGLSNRYPCVVLWVGASEAQAAGVELLAPGPAGSAPQATKKEGTKTSPGKAPASEKEADAAKASANKASAAGKTAPAAKAPAKAAPVPAGAAGKPAASTPALVDMLSGYLLSDLTAEPQDVVVLRKDPRKKTMTLYVYKRDAIRRIEVTDCGKKSILTR